MRRFDYGVRNNFTFRLRTYTFLLFPVFHQVKDSYCSVNSHTSIKKDTLLSFLFHLVVSFAVAIGE